MRYYVVRLKLSCRSWAYWLKTPYNQLEEITSPYPPNDLYFSVRHKGETLAANFWCMINDGWLDMYDSADS